MPQCNERSPVKLTEQKGMLCDTPQLPASPGQMKRSQRGGRDEGAKRFFRFHFVFVLLGFLFVFLFVFVWFGQYDFFFNFCLWKMLEERREDIER